MIKLISIFVVILFFSASLNVLDWYLGGFFLITFLIQSSLSVIGTILAIYIPVASLFDSRLSDDEKSRGEGFYESVQKELQSNIKFVFIILLLHLLLLIFLQGLMPENKNLNSFIEIYLLFSDSFYSFIFSTFATGTFLTFIYALYEISTVLFYPIKKQ